MNPVNRLLSLLSLTAAVVVVERLSPTTRILLSPYHFLRLHEVVQMSIIIPASIIISFLLLKIVTDNYRLLKTPRGTFLGSIFMLGMYFTATGNGAHEIASHMYNTFCTITIIESVRCGALYFNDYYFGNIVYFLGLALTTIALMEFERNNPQKNFSRSDLAVTIANGLVYALTLFAYGAFDPVLVGFVFTVVMAIVTIPLVLSAKSGPTTLPFSLYSSIGYAVSAIAIMMVRFR